MLRRMSLRLILMRHAKSSWGDDSLDDHARPLNGRGRRSATAMGHWLKERGYAPERVLSSDAVRTRETWAGVSDAMNGTATGPEVSFDRDLYLAPPEALLDYVKSAGIIRELLVLAHNPGIAQVAHGLAQAPAEHVDFSRYPTAATAVLDIDLDDWGSVSWGCAVVRDFMVPRERGV